MNFRRVDVITGIIVIMVVVVGIVLYRNYTDSQNAPSPGPSTSTTKEQMEVMFDYDIPEGSNAYELKDVSGGDGRGIATDNEILADLPDPAGGYFYQAWVEKDGQIVSLGKLVSAKGGWMLDYNRTEYLDYKKIVISQEETFDGKMEKPILESLF